MSLGLTGQRRRNRRRLAIAAAKMLLALSCILVIGWFSFRLGTERMLGQLARARAEAVRLEQDVSAVEVAWAISDLNAEALAGELGDMRRRFRDEMPGGPVRQLLPLIDAKLSQGVTTDRLATVIRAARNERRCDPDPATKRVAVRTSIGPTLNSSASFAEASITVTAAGTPVRNSDGAAEAWFDPALPVTGEIRPPGRAHRGGGGRAAAAPFARPRRLGAPLHRQRRPQRVRNRRRRSLRLSLKPAALT